MCYCPDARLPWIIRGIRFSEESWTDANALNSQVSVTSVDADVIRKLSAQGENTDSQLLNALEAERSRYEYRVGPGDILSIIVYDHPELTIPAGEQRRAADSGNVINPDGTIFYPYTGRIRVDGQTVDEIQENITSLLSEYIRDLRSWSEWPSSTQNLCSLPVQLLSRVVSRCAIHL